MNHFWKKRPGTTVLGVAFEHDRIEVVEVRRTNGSSEIRRTATLPLESDPLSASSDTLGRLLRTRLDEAGIRETRCAVSLPPHAGSLLNVDVPDLPDADRKSFLDLEAERGFAQGPENLLVRSTPTHPAQGPATATLVAVDARTVHRLEATLHAARLKPISFAIGLDVIGFHGTDRTEVALDLVPSGTQLQVRVAEADRMITMRVIDDAFPRGEDGSDSGADLDSILRELRITLGQLPPGIRDGLARVRVLGPSDKARLFASALEPRLAPLGLRVERVPDLRLARLPFRAPTHAPAVPALAVALLAAAGVAPTLDFLPPRVSAWHQFASRHSSKRVVYASAAAGGLLAITALAFFGQQLLLWRWQNRWDAMKTRVTRLEGMQREVRRYEPWFDPSVRSLGILRRLTESFPEDGSVSAKAIEIRAPSRVACTGTARDPQAWLRMLDTIRNAPGVADLQVEQVRGKSPIEFSFHFQWQPRNRS